MNFKTGDHVMITADRRTVPGIVHLASPNGRSLWLMFDAMLYGHAGNMPVLRDLDGTYRALVTGEVVGIVSDDAPGVKP